jgi:predicted nucleotide-binding protein
MQLESVIYLGVLSFVLTPDDMITKRDNVPATRDSILFQVGFFMESLGESEPS